MFLMTVLHVSLGYPSMGGPLRQIAAQLLLGLSLCSISPLAAFAQASGSPVAAATTATASDSDRLAKLEAATRDAKSSADNAWMLMSAALVLLMTGPGLALFYGGLVRKKNVLATMMQSFAMMCLVTVIWA